MPPGSDGKKGNKKYIFISYGHDELVSLASRLRSDLISRGYDVWFDADRILTGADWEHYIEDGLNWVSSVKDGYFILLMTPNSVRQPDGFCLNELTRAIQKGLKIIPIMLVLCEPPLSICRIQWLDMTDCVPIEKRLDKYEAKFKTLCQALERDNLSFDGFQSVLINALNPLSYDAEIRDNLKSFTGRKWVFEEIDKWMDSGLSRIFWITGNPGVGKTAISAWLCYNRREVVAFHFCRHDNVQKMDPRRCVMSLAYQLSTQLPDYEERLKYMKLDKIGDLNAKTLFDYLIVQPLSGISRPGRTVVLLIDALDEATVEGKNDLANFIASEFERTPEWLKLLVTSRPDCEIMGPMQAYTPFMLDVTDSRNEPDIRMYLERELKELNGGIAPPETIIEAIVKKSGGLFLYVRWIVKELTNGRLSLVRPDEFPKGLGGIYLNFFERQFPDIDAWESGVRPVLETILAFQEPLSLKLLSSLFNWSAYEERRFKRSLGSLFKFDKGKVRPFHRSIVEWLTDEYKHDPYFISVAEGHKILAERGWKMYESGESSWTAYLITYLPTHLCIAGRLEELEEVLNDFTFIRAEWNRDKFNVLKQWTFVEEHSPIKMLSLYRPIIDGSRIEDSDNLMIAVKLLKDTYHLEEALKLLDHLVGYYRQKGDLQGLQESIGNQAWILYSKSDFHNAMGLFKEQERICREIGDIKGLQYSIRYQANILSHINDFDVAMALFKEEEKLSRESGDMDNLLESLGDQCFILRCKGDYDGVLSVLREREELYRISGNRNGFLRCLHEEAVTLRGLGNLDAALSQLKKLEKICREIGNKEILRGSLTAQERILVWRGDLDAAMALNEEAERICHQLDSKYDLQDCIGERVYNLRARGDLDTAAALIDEEEMICNELGDKIGAQICAGDRGSIQLLRGDLDAAMAFFKAQERICREIGHKRDLAMSLSNQATALRMKGDPESAMALHNEAVQMLREMGYKYGLQEALGGQAMTFYALGDGESATNLLKEQEALCREMGAGPDLGKCLENQKVVAAGKRGHPVCSTTGKDLSFT